MAMVACQLALTGLPERGKQYHLMSVIFGRVRLHLENPFSDEIDRFR